MENDQQRPEGALIAQAIKAKRLSNRAVAQDVGLTEARIRQIVNGYTSAGRGQRVNVIAPAETLAKLASAVGVDERQLREAGREDAADILRSIRSRTTGIGVTLHTDRYDEALALIETWLASTEDEMHPPVDALWLWTPVQLAQALAQQVEMLERAYQDADRGRYQLLMRGKRMPDEEESDPRGDTAATKQAGASPADDVPEVVTAESPELPGPRRGANERRPPEPPQ